MVITVQLRPEETLTGLEPVTSRLQDDNADHSALWASWRPARFSALPTEL